VSDVGVTGPGADSGEGVQELKRTLRRELRARIAAIDPDNRRAWSDAICGLIVDWVVFQRARIVLLYRALDGEPDLAPVGRACVSRGVRVCLPRTDWDSGSMAAAEVADSESGLVEGRHGVLEPPPDARVVPTREIDLILVPGLGFDRGGGRLGRGAGFYDRLLGSPDRRAIACGVCFEAQVVEGVPREAHDQMMDAVTTEHELIEIGRGRGR